MPKAGFLATHSQRWWALYHDATPAEQALEPHIAGLGRVYRFQHPWLGYFCDFALPDDKVVVEVDGKSHRTEKGRTKDAARDARMRKHGWTVLRVDNETALADPESWVRHNLKPLLKDTHV